MRIALIGTRGVPARYGGFETAVEEVGRRLVSSGHEVTVYCRTSRTDERMRTHLGMRLVHLPALRHRSLETLSHTTLSALHHLLRGTADAAIVFNAANAMLLPLIGLRRTPIATHVDGLEWRRGKWGALGQRYYRVAETLSVRWSDALIADAVGISDYYAEEFGAQTYQIAYGAPILPSAGADLLAQVGVEPRGYHLVVARFEPENHLELALEGIRHSPARLPLLVVGSTPYRTAYVKHLEELAASDSRIHLLGSVWDQRLLDQLYANAATYVHGHSVGGTNPSLLRAMGAGSAVAAYDVIFNREVLSDTGRFFTTADELSDILVAAESAPDAMARLGHEAQVRAATTYDWDLVAKQYEGLCADLAAGLRNRPKPSGRRSPTSNWRQARRDATRDRAGSTNH